MADDQEQRTFEVIKLRIAFLQHITTLSGAAILIILALVERAETVKQVKLLAGTVPLYVLAALISVGGIVLLIGPPKIMRLERATTGGFTTVLAGSAFAGAIFLTAYYAAGGTPRLLQTAFFVWAAVFGGTVVIFLIVRIPLRWLLRWILRRYYDYDPDDPPK